MVERKWRWWQAGRLPSLGLCRSLSECLPFFPHPSCDKGRPLLPSCVRIVPGTVCLGLVIPWKPLALWPVKWVGIRWGEFPTHTIKYDMAEQRGNVSAVLCVRGHSCCQKDPYRHPACSYVTECVSLFFFLCKKCRLTVSFKCLVKPLLCTSYSIVRVLFPFRNLVRGLIACPFKIFHFLAFWSKMVIQSSWHYRTKLFLKLLLFALTEKKICYHRTLNTPGSELEGSRAGTAERTWKWLCLIPRHSGLFAV